MKIVSILIAAAFFQFFFLASDFANGKDGYWYVIQLKSLIEEGGLHSYESTLLYPIYGLFYFLLGDYIIALRGAIISLSVASSFSLYLVVQTFRSKPRLDFINSSGGRKKQGHSKWDLATLALLLFTPTPLFMATQYPKQSLALTLLVLSIYSFRPLLGDVAAQKKAEELKLSLKKNWARIVWGFVSLFAALLSHRLIPGLVAMLLGSLFLLWVWRRRSLRLIKYASAASLSAVVVVFVIFYFTPGVLNFADLERIRASFSGELYFPFYRYLQFSSFHPMVIVEGLSPLLSFFMMRRLPKMGGLAFAMFPFLVVPILFHLPFFDFFDLQIRLTATAFFLSYIPLLLILGRYIDSAQKTFRGLSSFVAALLCIVLMALHNGLFFYRGDKFEHEYNLYTKFIHTIGGENSKDVPELVVAHTGLAQFYEYHTGLDVLPWSPEERFDKTKTYRFVYGISHREFHHRLSLLQKRLPGNYKDYVIDCPGDYLYVREDIWVIFLETLHFQYDEKLEEVLYSWRNPMRVRPGYLFLHGDSIETF